MTPNYPPPTTSRPRTHTPPPPPAAAAPVLRRRHAAKGSRAVALALSVGTSWGLAGYLQYLDGAASANETSTLAVTPTAAVTATTTPTSPTTPAAESTTETTPAIPATTAPATSVTTTGLVDGTFVGATFTNRWGDVQVQVTVSGGAITSVDALQMPDDDRKSVSINSRAVPQLVQMTLSAQSADVDTVSGATYTSDGYRDSLQTAIDAARAAATS